jgi:hypothetical protein
MVVMSMISVVMSMMVILNLCCTYTKNMDIERPIIESFEETCRRAVTTIAPAAVLNDFVDAFLEELEEVIETRNESTTFYKLETFTNLTDFVGCGRFDIMVNDEAEITCSPNRYWEMETLARIIDCFSGIRDTTKLKFNGKYIEEFRTVDTQMQQRVVSMMP